MTTYDTWTKTTKNDITVTLSKKQDGTAGERLVAFLKWLSEKVVDPGYGKPEGGRPDQGLPPSGGGGGKPDNTLPGQGGKPDNTLPGQGGGSGNRPDNTLPGQGGRPDNTLPGQGGLHPEHPIAGIGDHADEIAKLILGKCFDCKQPK